jgi:hypothetical protein
MKELTPEIVEKLDEIARHFGSSRIVMILCTENFSNITRVFKNIDSLHAMSIMQVESKRIMDEFMTPKPNLKPVK